MSIVSSTIALIEAGKVPDAVVRAGIRKLLRARLAEHRKLDCEQAMHELRKFTELCSNSAIAEVPEKANEQHYEVPAEFFQSVLGPRLKYSCCYWNPTTSTLAEAEDLALEQTAEHAELENGQSVLELGCGWGSLSLWTAVKYPQSRVTAVSNSHQQRQYIEEQAACLGLDNLNVVTADINAFETAERFDRVLSVEMFEHMRNHRELMKRISMWLKPGGRLFVHIFCHRSQPYLFEDRGPQDWMTRYFFSGGMMPSDALLLNYQEHLALKNQWRWNGQHYQQTCDAWLEMQDTMREDILTLFEQTYGAQDRERWFQRWRLFFMACSELFQYNDGNEWWVSHYLFQNHSSQA